MNIRVHKFVPLLLVSGLAFGIGACNTMRGVGEDTESAGKAIQKKVDHNRAEERREERREHRHDADEHHDRR